LRSLSKAKTGVILSARTDITAGFANCGKSRAASLVDFSVMNVSKLRDKTETAG
jgi:hypothetical protein